LKKPLHLSLEVLEVNHAVKSKASDICGIKFKTQISTVFFNESINVLFANIEEKFSNGLSRKWVSFPTPCISVKLIIIVYSVGYNEKIRKTIINGAAKR